ncbi:hypothetical protein F4804DRAFT_338223 [Jackrogersella minutella]|nr:hypothetical protein F4804DRAFT_338223 [Jackrogersella minutella]
MSLPTSTPPANETPPPHDVASRRARRPAKAKAGVPQLNCELCRERKIKCDKSSPRCSNCIKAGIVCVPIYRKRLPRGRHTNPQSPSALADGDELRDRIRKLETLVSGMNEPRLPSATPMMLSRPGWATPISPGAAEIGTEKQVGQQFWAHITEEIDGLQGVVSNPSDDEESVKSNSNSAPSTGMRIMGICSPHDNARRSSYDCLRDSKVTSQLCQIYLCQVDPIIKVLHRPSVSKFMLNGQPYLGYELGHVSTTCLCAAIYYSAVASMTEEQCQAIFSTPKSTVIVDYRIACEAALEKSNLLTTSDITILQAFILYLVGRRTEDSSRAVWTMIALAVRIAKAMSIDTESTGSFFNRQMRQRLWYTICVLDLQSSFEQASEPLIELNVESSALPRNINDSEFDVDTPGDIQSRDGLTDVTFALVTYNAQLSGRLLNFYGKEADAFNWEERERHVSRFEQNVLNLLKFCDPEANSYAWFAFHGTQSLVAAMSLSALRPLHRVGSKPNPRTHLCPDLLSVALKVLDKVHLIRSNPRGEGFRWYVTVQWHALAITITECYVCTDICILRSAWPVVEAAFEHHKTVIENYRQGMLKKPLDRLMKQTRLRVNTLLRGQSSFQRASPLDVGSWGSLGIDQTVQSALQSPSITATETDSPCLISPRPVQTHPQQPIASLEFDFGGVSSLLNFESPAATHPPGPSWLTPSMSIGQSPEVGSVSEANGGTMCDASWRTWEEFVSGLSFDDIS